MAVLLTLPAGIAAQNSVVYPKPKLQNRSTGILESRVGGVWYRGSGVVAQDPRLIYSCAHVFHEDGEWATRMVFHRAWHERRFPRKTLGAEPRGLVSLASYSKLVETRGPEANRTFDADITLLYGNRWFGPAMPVAGNGGAAVRSQRAKRIVGYPAEIDFTRRSGYALQHATALFTLPAVRRFGAYHEIRGVSTGPGASGGPIFVQNRNGKDVLAGVVVSGMSRMAGVRALDAQSKTLANEALGALPDTLVFANRNRLALASGVTTWAERRLLVTGVDGNTRRVSFAMELDAPADAAVDAWLRSPDGTIRWIRRANQRSMPAAGGTEGAAIDLTDRFGGIDPNGIWTLHLRTAAQDVSFRSFSITLNSL